MQQGSRKAYQVVQIIIANFVFDCLPDTMGK